jgi:hypothetical protein
MAQLEARVLFLAIACSSTAAAWADETRAGADARAPVSPGSLVGERVRLFSRPSFGDLPFADEPLVGKVLAADAETLTVVKDKRTAETFRVPLSSIKRLDIGRPEWRSRAGQGALIGIAIPAAVAVAVASGKPSSRGDFAEAGPGLAAAAVLVIGVPIGALTGAIVGSQFHTQVDHWERVDTRRVRVSVLPDFHGGIRGGLAVRF